MRPPLGSWMGPSRSLAPSFSSRRMSASMSVESKPKCSRPKCAEAVPGWSVSPVRGPEMFTAMPPSTLWQRMKRSPNTRVSSLTILKSNAPTYHSAVRRGSEAFRWMWLIRYAMTPPQGCLCRRWQRSPSMITILVVVTPITSVPVVRPGSTAVMVARGTEYAPKAGLLDLLDLDDEIAIGELLHGKPHSIAPAQLRAVQQLLRLRIEGHLVHLVHEPWSGVMVDEHEGVSGAGLVDSRDAIETAPGIDITPGAPDAGGEARGEEEEQRGDGPAGGGRHHAGADRLRLARKMMPAWDPSC